MEQSLKERIVELREQGLTYDEIAEQTGTYKSNIHRVLKSVSGNLEQDDEDLEQEDETEWNDMEQNSEILEQEFQALRNKVEQNSKLVEQTVGTLLMKMEQMEKHALGSIQEEKKKVSEDVPFNQKLLDEKMEQFKNQMEHKLLQEKYNELEKRYKSVRAKYKAKILELDESVEYYEEEIEKIKSEVAELRKQASIGNNVLEGIKTAVPVLMQQKPVQQFLHGLTIGQETTDPIPQQQQQQPIPQEDDEFSEEEWEYMNLILDVKEAVKGDFQMVTVLLDMFMKNPSKIGEVVTFLTQDQEQ